MTRLQMMMYSLVMGCMLVPLSVQAQYYPQAYPDPYQQQAPQTGTTYDPYGGVQQHIPGQVPSASVPSVRAPVAQMPQASMGYETQMVPPQIPPGQIPPMQQPLPPQQVPSAQQQSDNGVNVYRVIKNGNTTYINRRRIIDPNNLLSTTQSAPQPGDIIEPSLPQNGQQGGMIDPNMQQGEIIDPNMQNNMPEEGNCYIPAGIVGMQVSAIQNMPINNPVRILGPNSQATMDYSPNRTNIMVDENQIVIGARCG